MSLMRWCPSCESERPLDEHFCNGALSDGRPCAWVLAGEPIHPAGWRPTPIVTRDAPRTPEPAAPEPAGARCGNGHPMAPGDLICLDCGAGAATPAAADDDAGAGDAGATAGPDNETVIDGWRLLRRIAETAGVRERYIAEHVEHGREAVLTLYHAGAEPDPDVYEAVRRLPRDYVPELIASGRWNDRAFEVMESLPGGTFAQLPLRADDTDMLRHILRELGQALNAFAEVGLRHRDLRPATLLVRSHDPPDLVIGGFGSARLSAFDLDLVPPLETSRYMAPEAIAGGVAAASDWWSLGMLLLERVTDGACFGDIHPNAWLIHVLTQGVPLPDDLSPELDLLFRGLLAHDHHQRWQWRDVENWLSGGTPPAPPARARGDGGARGAGIELGGRSHHDPRLFALAAGEAHNRDQALDHLRRGALATWAEQAGLDARALSALRHLAGHESLDDDQRLMLALTWLNPELPLLRRGEIVSPGWLLDHPAEGWQLLTGDAPDLLAHRQPDHWLPRMKARVGRLRERARHRGIALDEGQFRVLALATSRARLAAQWQARLALLPDSPHGGIQALAERHTLDEDDLIVLLAADIGQFHSADHVLDQAARGARGTGVAGFDRDAAAAWLARGRCVLWQAIDQRLRDFSRCGVDAIDQWADQYRLQRRLPLDQALVLLAVPEAAWITPDKQQYLSQLLRFFEKKVINAALRGPLVRMGIGRGSARIDLTELNTPRRPAAALLDTLLQRAGQSVTIDPEAFTTQPLLQHRINVLDRNRGLYQRDTGIDGLYLGFPFLLLRDSRAHVRTRIAPLLLWPVKLDLPVGQRAQLRIGFDSGREEVRLNPALEGLLGGEARERWQGVADDLLRRSAVTAAEVMDAFGMLAPAIGRELDVLPPLTTELEPGEQALACSAVLFHVTFMGQAIVEELRQLQRRSPGGTSLESLLRLREHEEAPVSARPPEARRYLTAPSDPSQEAAVLAASRAPGLVIEGPPGTGKSQTIVNIVADAIGTGRSLLLVCQKHAALDVVHKRLIAEGLGSRVVMLDDVNRDREPTIRAVREQIEALFRDGPAIGDTGAREQLATRIDALEGELDRRQQARHGIDPHCGSSWRRLVADLIELESGPPLPDCPALRPHLASLDAATLARIESAIAPLLRWWLPARYENSALARLRAFAGDEATCAAFAQAFHAFSQAEDAREQAQAGAVDGAVEIDDDAPWRAWLADQAGVLRTLRDDQRQRLARWLPLFRGARTGDALIDRLGDTVRTLESLNGEGWQTTTSPALSALPSSRLDDLARQARHLLTPGGWFAGLNPARWFGRARLRRFLRARGEQADHATTSRLLAAIELEAAWRGPRSTLTAIHQQLLKPAPSPDAGPGLFALASETLRQLREAGTLARRAARAPEPARADAALAQGDRAALDDWLDGIAAALHRHGTREHSRQCLAALMPWLDDAFAEDLQRRILARSSSAAIRAALADALPTLAAYQHFRTRAARLDPCDFALLAQLRPLQDRLDELAPAELETTVRRLVNREARLAWTLAIEQRHPELLLDDGEVEARVAELARLDLAMRQLNREELAGRIDLDRIGQRRQWEDITRLRGARTRRLREFIEAGSHIGLMHLKPVWLMNPDVASRVLPLRAGLFDVVVYDEASQMPVEYALPTLYRGRVAVVSGDEKQMPPTAFFASRIDDEDDPGDEAFDELDDDAARQMREEQWNQREIRDCPDLLHLARGSLPRSTLQIHYRSSYRELIGYSNAAFYDNHLHVPVRHPPATVRARQPMEWRQVDGVYRQQTNEDEARAVVDWLAELWRRPVADRPSVGVVTFNRKQADLIEDLMEVRAQEDATFRDALRVELERQQDGEDMGVFVKNVENVQGDERDVIVFSTTFGRDPRGVFRRNFGVLGQTGGERRLNVAVTRSRHKMLVMSSMPIADVADFLATRRAPGAPRDFLQGWLAYARMIGDGDLDGAQALLARMSRTGATIDAAADHPGDGFQRAVEAHVRSLGHAPITVGGKDAFALDFAIEDPRSGLYAIGIDCDSRSHPLLGHARAREIWRPRLLRRTIPVIHRVCALRWYRDPLGSQAELADAIHHALQEARP